MPFMLLIMEDRDRRQNWSAEQRRRAYERMGRFVESLEARGVYEASESLRSVYEGVRVQVRDGRQIVVDGPFAEAKEVVGGFFLLDCPTREDAVAIARECPATEWGTVEVREVGPCYE
jgi:hypothetical protein